MNSRLGSALILGLVGCGGAQPGVQTDVVADGGVRDVGRDVTVEPSSDTRAQPRDAVGPSPEVTPGDARDVGQVGDAGHVGHDGANAAVLDGASEARGTDGPIDRRDGGGASDSASSGGRWLMGYYPAYQESLMPAESVPWGSLTHLAVGAVLPTASGTLDFDMYGHSTLVEQLVPLAVAHHVKPILMVGGAGVHEGFVAAADQARRATFVRALVDYAQSRGFVGLDLDWEPIEVADQVPFEALARAIRQAWPEAILTVPVGALNGNYQVVDPWYARIAPLFDQINLMTYGMAGPYEGWQSWHSSPLSGESPTTPMSVEDSLERYVAAGIPAAKLGAGAGFYGICYSSPVTGPRQALAGATMSADDNTLAYNILARDYLLSGTRGWDEVAKVPFVSFERPTGSAGCTYISYEDARSLAEKGAWLKAHGYGGVIVWTINEGHLPAAGDPDPLLGSLFAALQ